MNWTFDRRAAWLLAAGMLGLILILSGQILDRPGSAPGGNDPSPGPAAPAGKPRGEAPPSGSQLHESGEFLSRRLEDILSDVAGVGRVHAWVTLSAGEERHFAADVDETESLTEEEDAQGGNRRIEERSRNARMTWADGRDPVVASVTAPRIRGVVVVAEGAADPRVRLRLLRAVGAVLDVPPHRVQIMNGRDEG